MERILVIDDDVELCHLVGEYFARKVLRPNAYMTAKAASRRLALKNTCSPFLM